MRAEGDVVLLAAETDAADEYPELTGEVIHAPAALTRIRLRHLARRPEAYVDLAELPKRCRDSVRGHRSPGHVSGNCLPGPKEPFEGVFLAVRRGSQNLDGDDVPLAYNGDLVPVLGFQLEACFEALARWRHMQPGTHECPELRRDGGGDVEGVGCRDGGQGEKADRGHRSADLRAANHLTRPARWKRRPTSSPK